MKITIYGWSIGGEPGRGCGTAMAVMAYPSLGRPGRGATQQRPTNQQAASPRPPTPRRAERDGWIP